MIFKDKEILAAIEMLENKIDMLVAMHKAEKIQKASKATKALKKGDE